MLFFLILAKSSRITNQYWIIYYIVKTILWQHICHSYLRYTYTHINKYIYTCKWMNTHINGIWTSLMTREVSKESLWQLKIALTYNCEPFIFYRRWLINDILFCILNKEFQNHMLQIQTSLWAVNSCQVENYWNSSKYHNQFLSY